MHDIMRTSFRTRDNRQFPKLHKVGRDNQRLTVGLATQHNTQESPRQLCVELVLISVDQEDGQGTIGHKLTGFEVRRHLIRSCKDDSLGKRPKLIHLQLAKSRAIRCDEVVVIDHKLGGVQGLRDIWFAGRLAGRSLLLPLRTQSALVSFLLDGNLKLLR
jgi:hypothetical protein